MKRVTAWSDAVLPDTEKAAWPVESPSPARAAMSSSHV